MKIWIRKCKKYIFTFISELIVQLCEQQISLQMKTLFIVRQIELIESDQVNLSITGDRNGDVLESFQK